MAVPKISVLPCAIDGKVMIILKFLRLDAVLGISVSLHSVVASTFQKDLT